MSLTTASLRDLHRIHQQQFDLTDRLTAGPRRVSAAETTVQNLQESFVQTKDNYTQARVHADAEQLQLQEREQRIVDTRNKLNICSTNKEFQTLKNQIDNDLHQNDTLSDEILELLGSLEQQEKDVMAAQESLDKASHELAKIRETVAAGQETLESELSRIQSDLEAAETSLPADLKVEYRRITSARGQDALAAVDGNVCGGCYQTVTPQTINELLLSKAVFCKSCGCLLYLAEDLNPDSN